MKITKDEIEVTPEEIRRFFDVTPPFFMKWILRNMERLTGIAFEKNNHADTKKD